MFSSVDFFGYRRNFTPRANQVYFGLASPSPSNVRLPIMNLFPAATETPITLLPHNTSVHTINKARWTTERRYSHRVPPLITHYQELQLPHAA
jgi:hypothetical protein